MSFANYSEFVTSLQTFMDNTDANAQTDVFIAMAHARLNRTLRLDDMEVVAEASTVAGDRWVTKPAGYLGMRRLKLNYGSSQVRGLDYVTPGEIDDTPAYNAQGTPAVFTIVNNRIRLGPIPNAVFTLELAYYKAVDTLDATTTTSNAFLTEVPDLLLYACCVEAGVWMRDGEMKQYWQEQYNARMEEVKADDEMGKFPSGQLAMRAV